MTDFIPVYQPDLSGHELDYITDCVATAWISSLGWYVSNFERQFAAFCQTRFAVAVSNGTVALHLALVLNQIGPGDEVIIPTLTFVATANAVRYTGARPVLVDVDPNTWTMAPETVAAAITPKTKAIMPVHLFGHPADMDPISQLAQQHQLVVIEDAAEAHGACYKQTPVGGLAQMGSFSFYGNKIITTGEGGMLTMNDEHLYQRALYLRDHAMSSDKRYWHDEVGFNYRMTNMQAAIGVAQLERIDAILEQKLRVAAGYRERLADCRGVILPLEAPWASHVYWLYSILLAPDARLTRDALAQQLRTRRIDSRRFFYPMHQLPPYRQDASAFPHAEDLAERGLSLPSYPGLTEADLDRICEAIRDSLGC